jgi:hypothetical protein
MARLFTFGCSFTQYMWPTWAHIVGYDMGIEFHNFALAGLGNVGIQHRIIEADIKHNFQKDDIIMIMWTSWCREDRVKNGIWIPAGSVLNRSNDIYDQKFVKKYWDYSNDIVKNSTAIIAINKMYQNNIKWQGTGFPLYQTESERSSESKAERHLIKFYQKSIPKISYVNTTKTDMDKIAFESILDCHPDVEEHLSIVEEHVYKKLNLTVKQETKDEFLKIQRIIRTHFTNNKITSSDDRLRHITDILSNRFPKVWDVMKVRQLID